MKLLILYLVYYYVTNVAGCFLLILYIWWGVLKVKSVFSWMLPCDVLSVVRSRRQRSSSSSSRSRSRSRSRRHRSRDRQSRSDDRKRSSDQQHYSRERDRGYVLIIVLSSVVQMSSASSTITSKNCNISVCQCLFPVLTDCTCFFSVFTLGPLLPSVLWHCWFNHLTHKTSPQYDL